jgi:outer membrane protein OmpA-like peptidoglycan-associated protein
MNHLISLRVGAIALMLVCSSSLTHAQGAVRLEAYGVLQDGERVPNVRIVREEVERTTLLPLLPYVFFELNSADLPLRYVQYSPEEARLFDMREFVTIAANGNRSVINAYYNVLNVIGRRLLEHPTLSVEIVGSSSLGEDMRLADQRASSVIEYLRSRFNLSAHRMRVGSPIRQKSTETDERIAHEYRRVSIVATWEITKPIIVRDTTITITPPGIDFELSTSIEPVNEVQLTAWQQDIDSPLYSYLDVMVPKQAIRWDLETDVEHHPTSDMPLSSQVNMVDASFKKYASNLVKIPVDQYTLHRKKSGKITGGKEIHQYNLILFDRNSEALRPDHERIIDSIVASDGYVLPTSRISVIGYADSTGTKDINDQLSKGRAQSVATRMKQRFSDVVTDSQFADVRGVGSFDVLRLPDGQTLPEGRFYSRTVIITIETASSW